MTPDISGEPQRAKNVHVRIKARQGPLHLAQLVALGAHGAGLRPDLIDKVPLEIWIILFPGRRQVHEVLLIGFIVPAGVGCRVAAVVFALVPENAADAVGQLGSRHPVEQVGIERIGTARHGVIRRICLMLVNPGAAHRPVDDANGYVVGVRQIASQIKPPVPDPPLAAFAHRIAPATAGLAVRADPRVRGQVIRQAVHGHGIRLSFKNIGVATDQVGHGVDDGIDAAGGGAIDRLVGHPAGGEGRGEGESPTHQRLAQGGVKDIAGIGGIDFQIDRVRRAALAAVVMELAKARVVAGVELAGYWNLGGTRHACHPWLVRGFLHRDDFTARNRTRAVIQHQGHPHQAAALGAFQRQDSRHGGGSRRDLFGHGHPRHAPGVIHIGSAGRLQGAQIRNLRGHRDGLAAIPSGGTRESELWGELCPGTRQGQQCRERGQDNGFF